VPDGSFGKCQFLNDVPLSELTSVLATHKSYVKSTFPSYEGKEAYVDAGDLGAEPEAYAKGKATDGEEPAESLKRNGVNGEGVKQAAVSAGGVPVDGSGHITNGVSLCCGVLAGEC
jgi:3-dehydroquinate synthase